MATILEYGVREACEMCGHNEREFSTGGFQIAMSRITNAKPLMNPELAEAILLSIPGVERDITPCTWKYKGPAIHKES